MTWEKLFLACTTTINWSKCKALWIGHTPAVGLPHLPRNLQWEKEGIRYLSVYIGTPAFMAKNWLNTVNKIDNRLEKWRGILLTLSYRGRALMIITANPNS